MKSLGWCITLLNGSGASIKILNGRDLRGMSADDAATIGMILETYREPFYITNYETLDKRYTPSEVIHAHRTSPPMRAG